MERFDSHAHLDMLADAEGGIDGVIDRARAAGVVQIVTVAGATRPKERDWSFALAASRPGIFVAAGFHPHVASQATAEALDELARSLSHERAVALGEIGLDYHYNHSPPARQREVFAAQLEMARALALPIIVHTREADDDTIAILREGAAGAAGGVVHCFSSGARLAEAALEMGLFLSFSGIVTFPKADEVRAIAATVPKERILAETDAPFLAPVPLRGRRNEPGMVAHVVSELARLRGVDDLEMGRLTAENARRCFRIGAGAGTLGAI